ncbi:MAG TPA: S-adenosylmethionine:tRNA ribosyltransferase-isomerase [Longimicrobiales bacterium]
MSATMLLPQSLPGPGFVLPADREASEPPEARNVPRDGVRLLISDGLCLEHVRFRHLPRFLRAGDLLVLNTSATLPAAVDARRQDGRDVVVHFSTRLEAGSWAVELRPPGRATGPARDGRRGERVTLPGGIALTLEEPYPDSELERPRLWRAHVTPPTDVPALLARYGRPIAYAYVGERWPLSAYQTVFAREPGSAEMPSAGRPFTQRLVTQLVARGVGFAPLVLHTGVSSLEAGEAPLPERFRVPLSTAARVMAARAEGGRIIAVGTTAARALESATDAPGAVRAAEGWTELVLGPDRPARVLDGIITGWHAPGASHLALLEAVAGAETVARAYEEALARHYLWHEFGDSCLLLRAP